MADKKTGATQGQYAWASFGLSMVQGWASVQSAKTNWGLRMAEYTAQRRITDLNNQATLENAQAQLQLQRGQNAIWKAQAAAENKLRQLSNKRILIRAEAEHESAANNFARMQESMTSKGIEAQVAAAEQRGAYAAHAALSGTLGSTVEGMEQSLGLKQAREAEYRERQNNYATYDQLKQMAGIASVAASQLDGGMSVPNLDYGYRIPQLQTLGPETLPKPNFNGAFFDSALGWLQQNPDGLRQLIDGLKD